MDQCGVHEMDVKNSKTQWQYVPNDAMIKFFDKITSKLKMFKIA